MWGKRYYRWPRQGSAALIFVFVFFVLNLYPAVAIGIVPSAKSGLPQGAIGISVLNVSDAIDPSLSTLIAEHDGHAVCRFLGYPKSMTAAFDGDWGPLLLQKSNFAEWLIFLLIEQRGGNCCDRCIAVADIHIPELNGKFLVADAFFYSFKPINSNFGAVRSNKLLIGETKSGGGRTEHSACRPPQSAGEQSDENSGHCSKGITIAINKTSGALPENNRAREHTWWGLVAAGVGIGVCIFAYAFFK